MGNSSYGSDPAIQAGAVLNIAAADYCSARMAIPPLRDALDERSRACGAPARYVVSIANTNAPELQRWPVCDALHLWAALDDVLRHGVTPTVTTVPGARYWRCDLASWTDQRRGEQGTGLCGGGMSDHLSDATVRVRQPDVARWGAYCFAHIATGVMLEGEGSDGSIGQIEWLLSCAGCFRPAAWAATDDAAPLDDHMLCGICRHTLEWGPNGWMPKTTVAAPATPKAVQS